MRGQHCGMQCWTLVPTESRLIILPCPTSVLAQYSIVLRQIAGCSTLKPLLNLVIGKFNKCVVLFCELGGKHVVILLPYLALSLLHHPLANEPHLAEGKQRLVSMDG